MTAARWFLLLAGLGEVVPGAIHYFLPDGGAGAIAGVHLAANAPLVVALFAWTGAVQLPFGLLLLAIAARQPGLVLEQLALLDDAPAAPAPASASAPAGVPGVSWQGVELQVLGRYGDIQRYLQALERELPGLRWGEMHLSASGTKEPPRLRAQLRTHDAG